MFQSRAALILTGAQPHSHIAQIYCALFQVFDDLWDEANASYMDFPRVFGSLKTLASEVFARPLCAVSDFTRALGEVQHNRIALAQTITEEFASFVPAADVSKMLLQQHDLYAHLGEVHSRF